MLSRPFYRCALIAAVVISAGCSKKAPSRSPVNGGLDDDASVDNGGSGGNGGKGGTGGTLAIDSGGAGAPGADGALAADDVSASDDQGGGGGGSGGGADAGPVATGSFNVLTQGYDNARSGANTSETILTTANVKAGMFGLKFAADIGGKMYAQPLYVSQLSVGGTKHNVVFAATAHNTVHAFDADSGTALWMRSLEPPLALGGGGLAVGCKDMSTEVGITSTPVISLADNKMYVVDKTSGKTMLHALDLSTGADAQGSPVMVGDAGFASNTHLNRPGLLLLGGVVYIAFGSHCDSGGYHGWIFGHDAKTLALKSTYNTTPGGKQGAIWQSGSGPASDGTSIWIAVGNGSSSGMDMSFNVVKLAPAGAGLNISAHFLDTVSANGADLDLDAGPVISGNFVLAGSKAGDIIVTSTADAKLAQRVTAGDEVHQIATWNGPAGAMVYTWPRKTSLHAWQLSAGGMLADKGTNAIQMPSEFGGIVSVSSNGTTAGTGVLWALVPTGAASRSGGTPGVLFAFDASDVTKPPLWSSMMDPKDALGGNAKFSLPVVANGKVYAATFSGKLMCYGPR